MTVPSPQGVFAQAKHLDEVPSAAREALALMRDVDPADVGPIDAHVQPRQGGAEPDTALRRHAAALGPAVRRRLRRPQTLAPGVAHIGEALRQAEAVRIPKRVQRYRCSQRLGALELQRYAAASTFEVGVECRRDSAVPTPCRYHSSWPGTW